MKPKQAPMRPTRRQILETLRRAGRENSDATVLFHSTMANLLGLHPTDYKVLGILQRLGSLTAGEIARQSGLAPASVTNLIDRLEGKGFVRRTEHHDRRRVVVEPVAERLSEAPRRFASMQRSLARLFDLYSDPELAVIADFLGRNAQRLRTETAKLEPAGRRIDSVNSPVEISK